KTIIAHSLPEYMKMHPVHHKKHGPQAGHAPPASATPAKGAAGGPPEARGKPAGGARTPDPAVTGHAKEGFGQECALLDTMKPSRENPEIYTALVNGKEATIAKAKAEAILAQIMNQMETTIEAISEYNQSILGQYEKASAKGLEHIGSGLNKLV